MAGLSLVVLAAGMGSRYGGLKQMEALGPSGQTLLEYSVYDAMQAGFDQVVFVIRPDFAEAFQQNVSSRFQRALRVDHAFQDPHDLIGGHSFPPSRVKPWGTGHAARAARHVCKQPFAVINADDFYGRPAFQALAAELGAKPAGSEDWCLVGYPLAATLSQHGTVSRGVCKVDPQGWLQGIEEHLKLSPLGDNAVDRGVSPERVVSGSSPVSMNCWGFTQGFFAQADAQLADFLLAQGQDLSAEFTLPGIVDQALANGAARAKVLRADSPWFGVTYPQDKPDAMARLAKLHAEGVYPSALWG